MKSSIKYIVALALLLQFFSSCETKQEKREKMEQEVKIEAHKHGCISEYEFYDYQFSYVYESNLPKNVYFKYCPVYGNIDIVKKVDTKKFTMEIGGESTACEWIGTPSSRDNDCWIVERNYSHTIYIGITKSQLDQVMKHVSDGKLHLSNPVVLKINQAALPSKLCMHPSYIADLIKILDEEKEK